MKLSDHFDRSEFACKCGCGFDVVDAELLFVLTLIRNYFNSPVVINSGARCIKHNSTVKGSKKSKHLLGIAADIVVEGRHANLVAKYLECNFPDKYGIGRYNGRTHIDVRKAPARWDFRTKETS